MRHSVYLKVKLKSLMEEARIIRKEERKALEGARQSDDRKPEYYRLYSGLREHRVGIVRQVARESHILYGFMRGRSYRQVERDPKSSPNWSNIEKMALRFGYSSRDLLGLREWAKAT